MQSIKEHVNDGLYLPTKGGLGITLRIALIHIGTVQSTHRLHARSVRENKTPYPKAKEPKENLVRGKRNFFQPTGTKRRLEVVPTKQRT